MSAPGADCTSDSTAGSTQLFGADGNVLAADLLGHGPVVVLLHGGGQTRRSWRATATRLAAAGHTAVAIDLRGHGDSDWSPDGSYSIERHAADVRAVLTQLGHRPVVVGASLGGTAALTALGTDPAGGTGLASALVLVDVAPRLEPAGVDRVRRFMAAAPDGFADLAEAADAVRAYLPGRSSPATRDGLMHALRRRSDGRWRWHWDPRILDGLGTDGEGRHRILAGHARAVQVPTLLVRGARSDVVSRAGADELAELMPHAVVAEIAGAGHMVAGDDNDAFTARIVHFVGTL